MATPPSPNDLTRQQLDELDSLLQRMLALPLSKPEPVATLPPPPPLPELPPTRGWRADVPAATAKTPYLAPVPEPEPVHAPTLRAFPQPPSPVPQMAPEPAPWPEPFVARIHTPPSPHDTEYAAPSPGAIPGTLRGVDAPALPFGYRPPEPDPEPEPDAAPLPSAFAGMNLDEVNPFADMAGGAAPGATDAEPTPAADRDSRLPVPLWPVFAANWVIEFALGWFGPLGHPLTRPRTKTLLGWAGVLLLVGAGAWAARGMGWVSWPR